jgi:Uma2 family endonuclease
MTESQFWGDYSDEDIKAEWVRGRVFVAPPATSLHSDINGWLLCLVAEFVEFHDLGLVRGPQFPIRLAHIRTIRIPDIIFVSKARSPRTCQGYLDGPPDLAVEIVSPDSLPRDWRDKYGDYQTAGVREYWVVNPLSNRVEIYSLERSKKYVQIQPDTAGRIHSKVLKGLYIQPQWLWRSPLPKLSIVLKELKLR